MKNRFKFALAALGVVSILGPIALENAVADSNVELYGLLDYGLRYRHTKNPYTKKTSNTIAGVSGERNTSRWGIRGREDLGSGYSIGFNLEQGINYWSGSGLNGSRQFGREAWLEFATPYFKIKGGRMGGFNGPNDSYLNLARYASPWAGGTMGGSHSGLYYNSFEDNAIDFMTAQYAGFNLYAHYSFNIDGDDTNPAKDNSRLLGFAVKYNIGIFDAIVSWEKTYWADDLNQKNTNSYTVALRALPKPMGFYLGGQYITNVHNFNSSSSAYTAGATMANYTAYHPGVDVSRGMSGWGVVGGASYEIGSLKLMLQAARTDYKVLDTPDHMAFWLVSTGFEYRFNKRLRMYGVLGYDKGNRVIKDLEDLQVVVGIQHWF